LPFPLEDCSVFGNFVITLIWTFMEAKLISQQTDKISQQPENGKTAMALAWNRHFQRNGGLNQILQRQTSRFHYGWKVPVVTITSFLTILGHIRYNSSQRILRYQDLVEKYYVSAETIINDGFS
jgi:hypothetical protein